MVALAWKRAALALTLALLGAQAALPHAHAAASSEIAIAAAGASDHGTVGADHAEECLLCRVSVRPRAVALAPAAAVAAVATPRIPVVAAPVRAKRGPDLGAGPAPRAPPPLSPLV